MITTGWSIYIVILVAINLVGCVWLLWWTSKRNPGDPAPDDTGHVWDENITEFNKPLPRWWINKFYITIIFAVIYLALFPGLGSFLNAKDWSAQKEHDADKAVEDQKLEAAFKPFAGIAIDKLALDPKAVALGQGIFANTCAACHGSNAKGNIGYPNLTDDIWHWGGSPEQVVTSVIAGRQGVMPPWGDVLRGMGGENAVDYTVAYVRALSDPSLMKTDFLAARGKKLYEGVCVACHGIDGKGNQEIGAPNLVDNYWLYGDTNDSIRYTIEHGRHGIMPAHGEILGETRARLAAAYVWSLSQHPVMSSSGSATTSAPEAVPTVTETAPATPETPATPATPEPAAQSANPATTPAK